MIYKNPNTLTIDEAEELLENSPNSPKGFDDGSIQRNLGNPSNRWKDVEQTTLIPGRERQLVATTYRVYKAPNAQGMIELPFTFRVPYDLILCRFVSAFFANAPYYVGKKSAPLSDAYLKSQGQYHPISVSKTYLAKSIGGDESRDALINGTKSTLWGINTRVSGYKGFGIGGDYAVIRKPFEFINTSTGSFISTPTEYQNQIAVGDIFNVTTRGTKTTGYKVLTIDDNQFSFFTPKDADRTPPRGSVIHFYEALRNTDYGFTRDAYQAGSYSRDLYYRVSSALQPSNPSIVAGSPIVISTNKTGASSKVLPLGADGVDRSLSLQISIGYLGVGVVG